MSTDSWTPVGTSARSRRLITRFRSLDGRSQLETAAGAVLVLSGLSGLVVLAWAVLGGFLREALGLVPAVPLLIVAGALTTAGRLAAPRAIFLVAAAAVAGTAATGNPALLRTGAVTAGFAGLLAVLTTHGRPVRPAVGFGILTVAALVVGLIRQGTTGIALIETVSITVGYGAAVTVATLSDRLRRASTDRFSTLARAAPIGIWEHDLTRLSRMVAQIPDGTEDIPGYLERHTLFSDQAVAAIDVISANPAALDLPPLFDSDNPAARKVAAAALSALADGRNHFGTEVEVAIADRPRRTVRIDGAIGGQHGELNVNTAIVTAVDVTAQRDAQRALARQMADRTSLLATISHELRTPLTAVLGFGAILRDRTLPPDHAAEAVGAIVDETRRMSNVVEDLLVASRLAIGDVAVTTERVDLTAAARSAIASSGVAASLEISPRTYVVADAVRIRQVLRNLLTNALDHGGQNVHIVADQSADLTWIEVRDDGGPIPDRLRRVMFEPYRRGQETPGLTATVGLGLTISSELARLMGGAVEYDHDGNESIFRLTLRTWVPSEKTTAESPAPAII